MTRKYENPHWIELLSDEDEFDEFQKWKFSQQPLCKRPLASVTPHDYVRPEPVSLGVLAKKCKLERLEIEKKIIESDMLKT